MSTRHYCLIDRELVEIAVWETCPECGGKKGKITRGKHCSVCHGLGQVINETLLYKHAQAWEQTRRVAETMIGPYQVSTIFLGFDHNYMDEGPPVIFETMVFDHSDSHYCEMFGRTFSADKLQRHYCTLDEAEAGHAHAVKAFQRLLRWAQIGIPANDTVSS